MYSSRASQVIVLTTLFTLLLFLPVYAQQSEDSRLDKPVNLVVAKPDKISAQNAVKNLVGQVGLKYSWTESFNNTDPICRRWVYPEIKGIPCREALDQILNPLELTYEIRKDSLILHKQGDTSGQKVVTEKTSSRVETKSTEPPKQTISKVENQNDAPDTVSETPEEISVASRTTELPKVSKALPEKKAPEAQQNASKDSANADSVTSTETKVPESGNVSATNEPSTSKADDICKKLESAPNDSSLLKELAQASREVSEKDAKCRYIAICSLGFLANGDTKTWTAGIEFLNKTDPQSPYLSVVSFTNLAETCTDCSGTGYTNTPCQKCNGSGKCPICGGSGYISGIGGNKICGWCHGSRKCRECDGTGRIKSECETCHGRGRTLSKDNVQRVYLNLLKPDKTGVSATLDREKDNTSDEALVQQEQEKKEAEARQKLTNDLYEKHKNELGEYVDFKRVLISPEKYTGKVVISSVYMVAYFLFRPSVSQDFYSFSIPDALEKKTRKMWDVLRDSEPVKIKYLVVNEDGKRILLDIEY